MDILIAEDDILLSKVMAAQIEAMGLPFRTAGTGKAVLELIADQPPALLILDVSLPDMTALDIILRLRQDSRTCSLPVIVHTNIDLVPEQSSELQLGPTKIVTKTAAYSDAFKEIVLEMIRLHDN